VDIRFDPSAHRLLIGPPLHIGCCREGDRKPAPLLTAPASGEARAPPRKPYETLCIGRSSDRLLNPPLQYSYKQLTSASPPNKLLRIMTHLMWPDLFTGVDIYPMLIVFRAEHAACLKHSSLFKVNMCVSGHLPSLVGRGPRKGVFPLGE